MDYNPWFDFGSPKKVLRKVCHLQVHMYHSPSLFPPAHNIHPPPSTHSTAAFNRIQPDQVARYRDRVKVLERMITCDTEAMNKTYEVLEGGGGGGLCCAVVVRQ